MNVRAVTKWERMVRELLDAGVSIYQLAKVCAKDDRNKVKRWAEGRAIPDADEGPILEQYHAERMRDVTSLSRQQMSMTLA